MYTINDLCLLCLENNKNLKIIVSEDCDGVPIEEKLRSFLFEFATIKPNISKHNRICLRCLEKLNDISNFKQQCIQNIIKLNSCVHLLNDSNEPCENVPVTSIKFQNLKEYLATPNNKKHTVTVVKTLENQLQENNFGTNVITKKEPLAEDSEENELEEPDERIPTAEVDVQMLDENIVKTEQEIADYDAKNEKEENYFEGKQGAMNVDDCEMKCENFEEITIKQENFYDEAEANGRNEFPNETSNAATSPTNENIPEKERTNKNLYSCKDCNKSFHYIKEQSYKCPTCHKTFEHSEQLRKHKLSHNEQVHACDVCHKAFKLKSKLTVHKRIHSNARPYKCSVCNKAFAQKVNLTRHERIHTGKKPYKCNECNKAFAQSSDLTKHKRIHTGKKPYKCNVCNVAFSQLSNLKTHERIHNNDRRYKCSVCNTAFTQKFNLTSHMRKHEIQAKA